MTSMKSRAPRPVKRAGRRLSVAVGRVTSDLRMTPSFLLAGAQRCGTTSLYRALVSHPAVLPPVHHKGVNYFDVGYQKGWAWYQAHFPVRALAAMRNGSAGPPITFDASGYYMYHPHAPARFAADLPDVKVLVVLRDPIERAWSAFKHETARGFETESFTRALELEDERVEADLARMESDPHAEGFSHRHHSYRRRGQYVEQLQRIVDVVPRERLLVLDSQDFFTRPHEEFSRVTEFLGLPHHEPEKFDRWNARPGSEVDPAARAWLARRLAPYDEALTTFLGEQPSWCRG